MVCGSCLQNSWRGALGEQPIDGEWREAKTGGTVGALVVLEWQQRRQRRVLIWKGNLCVVAVGLNMDRRAVYVLQIG